MGKLFILIFIQVGLMYTSQAQNWSANEFQEAFIQLQKQSAENSQLLSVLQSTFDKLKTDYESLEISVKDNLLPIGFIYTELPGQPAPHQIWPEFTWTDVSAEYSGLFFRVLGGNSDVFGSTQGQSSPRISVVETVSGGPGWYANMPDSGWSELILTGDVSGNQDVGMRFHVESNENRPVNTAVRIWRRNG